MTIKPNELTETMISQQIEQAICSLSKRSDRPEEMLWIGTWSLRNGCSWNVMEYPANKAHAEAKRLYANNDGMIFVVSPMRQRELLTVVKGELIPAAPPWIRVF